MRLLSLEDSLNLDIATANELYSRHLNKHLLQVFRILGFDDLDVVGAEGIEIRLANGRTLLDFSAGVGIVGLGHNHPRILAAERRCHESKVLDCIKIAPHKLQGALAHNLAQFLPDPLRVSFFTVSGSEAVEAALKLCERIQLPKGRTKFVCSLGAFHGKTHGSLSLTTAGRFQRGFLLGIPAEHVVHVPYGDAEALRRTLDAESEGGSCRVIAAIVEPIRGESCEVPPDGYLGQVARLCRERGVLSIFDEVKVGMGRTGRFCAFQHEEVVPDVVTLAKTLGGGKRAIGAMVTSQSLFDQAYGNKQDCTLHTSGFGGLGESCAVAIETLNVLHDEDLVARARERGEELRAGLDALRAKHPSSIVEVRGRGLFQAIQLRFRPELLPNWISMAENPWIRSYHSLLIAGVVRELYERHGILTHFQPGALDFLHFLPPLVVGSEHIQALLTALDEVLSRGLPRTTLSFLARNLQRAFSHS